MSTKLLKGTGSVCYQCRLRLLGPSVLTHRPIRTSLPHGIRRGQVAYTAPFSHAPARLQDALSTTNTIETPDEAPEDTSDPLGTEALLGTEAPLPWYLQEGSVDGPEDGSNPLAARQEVPELPPYPPPMLASVLQHLSVDIGLDNLTILDLRRLDPPPALGANLLMIIGTARSERHLHISADRHCRWLRSIHRLRPFADGLLGRNQLKLKLRRKARRQRLAPVSALKQSAKDAADDGISASWICVNVGRIPAAADAPSAEPQRADFVGFREETKDVSFVVQMFTEGHREVMDLERLWSGILKRANVDGSWDRTAEADKQLESLENRTADQEGWPGSGSEGSEALLTPNIERLGRNTPRPRQSRDSRLDVLPPPIVHQARSYHTTSRRLGAADPLRVARAPSNREPSQRTPVKSLRSDHEVTPTQQAQSSPRLGEGGVSASGRLSEASPSSDKAPEKQGVPFPVGPDTPTAFQHSDDEVEHTTTPTGLALLLSQLRSVDSATALQMLGDGAHDTSSTDFLQRVYAALPRSSSATEWSYLTDIYHYAATIEHDGYTAREMLVLINSLHLSGVVLTERMLSNALKVSLIDLQKCLRHGLHCLPEINAVLANLRKMESFGVEPLSYDNVSRILDAITPPPAHRLLANEEWKRQYVEVHNNLTGVLDDAGVVYAQESFNSRLLQNFATLGHWRGFWGVWQGLARRELRRSPQLYAFVLQTLADSGHQARCQIALRLCIPQMRDEEPEVPMTGQVAQAVKACLAVAEPTIASDNLADSALQGEWISLWEHCSRS